MLLNVKNVFVAVLISNLHVLRESESRSFGS